MSQITRVFVATPDTLTRIGICTIITAQPDFELLGETAQQNEIALLCARLNPQIAIIGSSFPLPCLIECIRSLRAQNPIIATLIVTSSQQSTVLQQLIQAGATGFLLITEPVEAMLLALRTLAAGGVWLKAAELIPLLDKHGQLTLHRQQQVTDALTLREEEILTLVAQGWDNEKIARTLNLSGRTVRFHLHNIYDKLHVASRSQAIVWALNHTPNVQIAF